jgi:ketosteroid isomerase-like protein
MGDAKKAVEAAWEVIESGKLDKIGEVFDADGEFKMPGMAFRGAEALKQMLGAYTPQGSFPATGKKFVWDSCDVVRVRNGKVFTWHVYHDMVPFLMGLGALPSPK